MKALVNNEQAGRMKNGMNRRNFLRITITGLGSLVLAQFLSACQRLAGATATGAALQTSSTGQSAIAVTDTLAAPSDTPTTAAPTDTSVPAQTATAEPAYLAVARGGDDPEALVRAAVAAIGGIGRFVPAGAKVLIKPNICFVGRKPEYAVTTNPFVVAGLVKLSLDAGAASVRVLDYPFYGTSKETYLSSGIQEQVEAAGGEMVLTSTYYKDSNGTKIQVDYNNWVPQTVPNGVRLKSVEIIDEVLNADVLINVPIAKTHDTTRLTLGMKNLMGVIHDRNIGMHSPLKYIHDKIADLAAYIKPDLTVIDAVRILIANGPKGGSLSDVKKIDTVIASADIVAADAYATGLFGLTPDDVPYIGKAAALGLGTSDLTAIRIQEIALGG
jgi:uncharacterized protein (DUF362 family)